LSAPSVALPVQSILVHNDENTINLANANNFHNQQTINLRHVNEPEEEEEGAYSHDSPNWGKFKSGFVLLSCTALYSFIAGKRIVFFSLKNL
jgi:hypothetical protein